MKSNYDGADGPITLQYNLYEEGSKVGKPSTLEVGVVPVDVGGTCQPRPSSDTGCAHC